MRKRVNSERRGAYGEWGVSYEYLIFIGFRLLYIVLVPIYVDRVDWVEMLIGNEPTKGFSIF